MLCSVHPPKSKKTRLADDALRADYRQKMREKAGVKTPTRNQAADKSDPDDDSETSGDFNLAFDVDISQTSSRSTPATTSSVVRSSSKRASPTLDFDSPRARPTAVRAASRPQDGGAGLYSSDEDVREVAKRRTSQSSAKTAVRGRSQHNTVSSLCHYL